MSDNQNNNGKVPDEPLDNWNDTKRFLLVVFSALLWILSIAFSYVGFRSETVQDWYYGAAALVLSGTITTLELWLNSQVIKTDNMTFGKGMLWLGGLGAYAYGIWTNILGLSIMMIGTKTLTDVPWQTQVIPIIAGFLLEALPEPMYLEWRLSRKSKKSVIQRAQEQVRTVPDEIKRHNPAPQQQKQQPMPPRVRPELSRFRSSR